jgi:hypothetical protein
MPSSPGPRDGPIPCAAPPPQHRCGTCATPQLRHRVLFAAACHVRVRVCRWSHRGRSPPTSVSRELCGVRNPARALAADAHPPRVSTLQRARRRCGRRCAPPGRLSEQESLAARSPLRRDSVQHRVRGDSESQLARRSLWIRVPRLGEDGRARSWLDTRWNGLRTRPDDSSGPRSEPESAVSILLEEGQSAFVSRIAPRGVRSNRAGPLCGGSPGG